LRLLELLAEAVHSIAVSLFNLDEKCHVGDIQKVVNHIEPPEVVVLPGITWTNDKVMPPYPTLFTFPHYHCHEQYPNGVADIAGYWAEDKIFGGVLLFDRGVSGSEASLHMLVNGTNFRFFRTNVGGTVQRCLSSLQPT